MEVVSVIPKAERIITYTNSFKDFLPSRCYHVLVGGVRGWEGCSSGMGNG